MKVSATTLVLAAALGVAARPSGHGHKAVHRSLAKRLEFFVNKKPDVGVAVDAAIAPATTPLLSPQPPQTNQSPQSSQSSSVASPPKTQSSTSSSPNSISSGSPSSGGAPKQFCGGNKKRATLAQIAYKGNLGAPNNYGCNIMVVDSASGYDYTATFENNSGNDQKCVAWLKIGPDGGINGFFNGNQALSFDLPAGSKKVLAAEANSQGGVACGAGKVGLSGIGQFADTWFEFDFANESNQGHSGADVSCLVAASNNLPVQAMKVCADGAPACSVINNGGTGTNAYVANTEHLDGIGLNINPGPIAFKVTVG